MATLVAEEDPFWDCALAEESEVSARAFLSPDEEEEAVRQGAAWTSSEFCAPPPQVLRIPSATGEGRVPITVLPMPEEDGVFSVVGGELWDAAILFAHWSSTSRGRELLAGSRLLELGSGLGLAGLAAGHPELGAASSVHLTDFQQPLLDNLQRTCEQAVGKFEVTRLDWNDFNQTDNGDGNGEDDNEESPQRQQPLSPHPHPLLSDTFDLVVGAALIYAPHLGRAVAQVLLSCFLHGGARAAIVLQMPSRPGFSDFLLGLDALGLSHEEVPVDKLGLDETELPKLHADLQDFVLCTVHAPS